jgi:hypothetical protein
VLGEAHADNDQQPAHEPATGLPVGIGPVHGGAAVLDDGGDING